MNPVPPVTRTLTGGPAQCSQPGNLAPAAAQVPADRLDRAGQCESDAQRQQQPLPGCSLERLAAEVAEQRRVGGPDQPGGRVEHRETRPGEAQRPRAERHGGPAAGDETCHGDELAAARGELGLGPADGLAAAIAAEEALRRAPAEPAADEE